MVRRQRVPAAFVDRGVLATQQAAEKLIYFVIPSEARNLSLV